MVNFTIFFGVHQGLPKFSFSDQAESCRNFFPEVQDTAGVKSHADFMGIFHVDVPWGYTVFSFLFLSHFFFFPDLFLF